MIFKGRRFFPLLCSTRAVLALCLATGFTAASAQPTSPAKVRPAAAAKQPAFTYGQHPEAMAFADDLATRSSSEWKFFGGGQMQSNWSANTEPQLQEVASPQVLRSGCLQR